MKAIQASCFSLIVSGLSEYLISGAVGSESLNVLIKYNNSSKGWSNGSPPKKLTQSIYGFLHNFSNSNCKVSVNSLPSLNDQVSVLKQLKQEAGKQITGVSYIFMPAPLKYQKITEHSKKRWMW